MKVKSLRIDIPDELHTNLKMCCVKKKQTMGAFIAEAIKDKLKEENK